MPLRELRDFREFSSDLDEGALRDGPGAPFPEADAAGARRNGQDQKEPPSGIGTEPEDRGLGRSRGGFTTTLSLLP